MKDNPSTPLGSSLYQVHWKAFSSEKTSVLREIRLVKHWMIAIFVVSVLIFLVVAVFINWMMDPFVVHL